MARSKHPEAVVVKTTTIQVVWNSEADAVDNPGRELPPVGTVVDMGVPKMARSVAGKVINRGPFRTVYWNGQQYCGNTAHLRPVSGTYPSFLYRFTK